MPERISNPEQSNTSHQGAQCREYLAIFDDNLSNGFSGMVKESSFTTEKDSYIWSEMNYASFSAIARTIMGLSLLFSGSIQYMMAAAIVLIPLIQGSPIDKHLPWFIVAIPLITALLLPFKRVSIAILATFIIIRSVDYNMTNPFFEDDFMKSIFYLSLFLLLIFVIFALLYKASPSEHRMDTLFNRKTGNAHIYCKTERKHKEFPFSELIPSNKSWSTPMQNSIEPGQTLTIIHKKTGLRACKIIVNNGDYYDPFLRWEIFQQFMDPSLPLPDVPEFEPVRKYDPVTKEHDHDTSRPANFFRDMGRAESILRCKKAKEAADDYLWGMPREQARSTGWLPSIERISKQELEEAREREKDTFQDLSSEATEGTFFKRSLPFLLFCILLMLLAP